MKHIKFETLLFQILYASFIVFYSINRADLSSDTSLLNWLLLAKNKSGAD